MKRVFFYAIGILAFVACSKEVESPLAEGQVNGNTVVITTDVSQVKSTEAGAVFSWADNETISVGTSDEEYVTFDIADKNAGTFQHTFTEAVPSLLVAVSPAQQNAAFKAESRYDVEYPAVYNNYMQGTTNALMVGTPDPNTANRFIFRHVGALLKITYANVPLGTTSFVLEADQYISGTVHLEGTSTSQIEINNQTSGLTGSEVWVNLPAPVKEANTTLSFYVPVPTGSYEMLMIHLEDANGSIAASEKTMDRSGKTPLTLARGDVFTFPTITLDAAPELEDKVFFEERFSAASGQAGWSGGAGAANFASDNEGWVSEKKYGGDKAARFGTGSVAGNATTPSISIDNNYWGETLNLSFRAGAWNNDPTDLGISAEGASLSTESVTIKNNEWTIFNLTLTNIKKSPITITFTHAARWFLDDVLVYYGEKPVEKEKPGLTFANDNVKAVLGASSFEAPVLTNDKNVPITWESSNTEVADFEGDNLVIKAAGTTTISAIFAGNDQYAAQTVTYTLIVEEASLEVSSVKPSNVPSQANSTATFTVTSNVPWTASSDSDYISSIEPSSEQVASDNPVTVTVTFKANSGTIRTAIINVKPSDQTHFSSLNKTVEITQNEKSTVDILNYDWSGITGTSYDTATPNGSVSKAQYSIYAAGGNESIQLRTNNSNSGIVTTKSGGILKKITVKWNNNTANDRVLDVYAKNSAYGSPSDLYSDTKQGTKITSFAKVDGDGSYTFTTDYEFIGIRSASGALYLDEVDIEWDETSWSLSKIEVTKAPNKTAYIAGESFVPDGMEVTATYVDDSDNSHTKTKVVTGYTYDPSDALTESDNTVTISYKEGDVTKTATVAISVAPKPTLNAELSVSGLPTEFNVGDSFSFGEGTVKAVYSDNSEKELSITDVTIEGFDSTEEATGQEVTIKYTEDSVTASATVTVDIVGGGGTGEEATSTLTFSAKCGGKGTADDDVSWSVISDGTESNFDNDKGIHYGTSSASVQYIKLSTSGISGTITKIVVNASTASGVSATAGVTVGGSAFGGNAQSLSTSATNYTFIGSAKGEIMVTVTKPSKANKAIYVKSIAVTYTK